MKATDSPFVCFHFPFTVLLFGNLVPSSHLPNLIDNLPYLWEIEPMKTTLEIPDPIFRRAKSVAAERGIPFREFVTEAVKDKLVADAKAAEQPWMAAFGKLRHLRKETAKINRLIEEEFEQIEAEDRQ